MDKVHWPKDRLYSPQHFWIRSMGPHTGRLGLTETGAQLLHPVSAWSVVRSGRAEAGRVEVVAQLGCGQALLRPACPVFEFRVNPCLDIDPVWPVADPWLSGYLLEFDFDDWSSVSAGWLELPQTAPLFSSHRQTIHKALEGSRLHPLAIAADGGLPVAGLHRTLGFEEFASLLRRILQGDLIPGSGS
jgi:hypothetical protein